jgi:hypothetical protein
MYLVSKTEIQSFVARVRCVCKVVNFLLLRHRIPLCVALLIPENIIALCESIQSDIETQNSDKRAVTPLISRRIVLAIYVRRDDTAPGQIVTQQLVKKMKKERNLRLDKHVVKSSTNCTRTYCVRVTGAPAHLDCVSYTSLAHLNGAPGGGGKNLSKRRHTQGINEQQSHYAPLSPFVDRIDVCNPEDNDKW